MNLNKKHGRKGSNSRHSVLETDALPTELRQLSYARRIRVGVAPPLRLNCVLIVNDFDHLTGTNGTATFTDSETETLVHGDVGNQLNVDGDMVARHDHFHTFGKGDFTGNVGGSEVELRTILVTERGVTATFFFAQGSGRRPDP